MFKSTAIATVLCFGLISANGLVTYADEGVPKEMDEQPVIMTSGDDPLSTIKDKDEESTKDEPNPAPPPKPEDQ